jgi:hypothetical protein
LSPLGIVISALVIIVWIGFAFFFIRAIYHFIKMLRNFRSKTHDKVSIFVPLLIPILPAFFTDEGNWHRQRFLKNMGIALLLAFVFVGIRVTMELYK